MGRRLPTPSPARNHGKVSAHALLPEVRGFSDLRVAPYTTIQLIRIVVEPFANREASVSKGMRGRKIQRALMQLFKPEHSFTVPEAPIETGRQALVGSRRDSLVSTPTNPAKGKKLGERGNGPEPFS